jgi:acyl carrier protein
MGDVAVRRNQVRQDVLDYLAEYTGNPALRDAQGDVTLSDCGLDSFGTFEFIMGLEPRFDVTIRDEQLHARRLRSVNGVVDLLVEFDE